MSIKTLYEFYRFKLQEIQTIVGKRQYVDHPGAVGIIAVNDEGQVLMERQLRVEVNQELLEVPAGLIEPNLTRLETAKKELLEETGYVAENWKELYTYYNSAGILNQMTTVYLATGLSKLEQELEESEKITLKEIRFMEPVVILEKLLDSNIPVDSIVPVVALGLQKILNNERGISL